MVKLLVSIVLPVDSVIVFYQSEDKQQIVAVLAVSLTVQLCDAMCKHATKLIKILKLIQRYRQKQRSQLSLLSHYIRNDMLSFWWCHWPPSLGDLSAGTFTKGSLRIIQASVSCHFSNDNSYFSGFPHSKCKFRNLSSFTIICCFYVIMCFQKFMLCVYGV